MAKVKFTKSELKTLANRLLGRLKAARTKLEREKVTINTSFIDDVTELQRKLRGIELANERCAKLERQVEEILARLNSSGTLSSANVELDDQALHGLAGELEQLNGKVDELWGDLDRRVQEHERRLNRHDEQFSDLDTRLTGVEAGQSALHAHVANLEGSEVETTTKESTPVLVWIVGALAGVAASIVWANIDFSQTFQGETFIYEFAEGPLGWLIAGLVAFAVVAGVLNAIVPKTVTTTHTIQRRQEATTIPIPQPPQSAEAGNPTKAAGETVGSPS